MNDFVSLRDFFRLSFLIYYLLALLPFTGCKASFSAGSRNLIPASYGGITGGSGGSTGGDTVDGSDRDDGTNDSDGSQVESSTKVFRCARPEEDANLFASDSSPELGVVVMAGACFTPRPEPYLQSVPPRLSPGMLLNGSTAVLITTDLNSFSGVVTGSAMTRLTVNGNSAWFTSAKIVKVTSASQTLDPTTALLSRSNGIYVYASGIYQTGPFTHFAFVARFVLGQNNALTLDSTYGLGGIVKFDAHPASIGTHAGTGGFLNGWFANGGPRLLAYPNGTAHIAYTNAYFGPTPGGFPVDGVRVYTLDNSGSTTTVTYVHDLGSRRFLSSMVDGGDGKVLIASVSTPTTTLRFNPRFDAVYPSTTTFEELYIDPTAIAPDAGLEIAVKVQNGASSQFYYAFVAQEQPGIPQLNPRTLVIRELYQEFLGTPQWQQGISCPNYVSDFKILGSGAGYEKWLTVTNQKNAGLVPINKLRWGNYVISNENATQPNFPVFGVNGFGPLGETDCNTSPGLLPAFTHAGFDGSALGLNSPIVVASTFSGLPNGAPFSLLPSGFPQTEEGRSYFGLSVYDRPQ